MSTLERRVRAEFIATWSQETAFGIMKIILKIAAIKMNTLLYWFVNLKLTLWNKLNASGEHCLLLRGFGSSCWTHVSEQTEPDPWLWTLFTLSAFTMQWLVGFQSGWSKVLATWNTLIERSIQEEISIKHDKCSANSSSANNLQVPCNQRSNSPNKLSHST